MFSFRTFTFLAALLLAVPAYAANPGDACTAAEDNSWQVSDADANTRIYCDGTQWRTISKTDESGAATSRIKQVLTFGNEATACSADLDGTIRYTGGSPPWEYCDGSAWVNFKQPQCQDDDTGECYLEATRSNDDPEFLAANIKNGVNILNVTGTYSAAACGVEDFSFTDDLDAALSTLTSSDIVLIDTDACSATVDITGAGSPEFRICNDATCSVVNHAWGSAQQSIDDGEYLQLRLTSGGEHVSRSATVTVGGSIRDWNVLAATYKYVFVSSTTSDGDLGGIAGADATCQSLADTAGLAGIYKAWLGHETTGPAAHFPEWTGEYRLSNGTTKVADSWTALTGGGIDNAISRDENHNTVTEIRVWTGSTEWGGPTVNEESCDKWTNSANNIDAVVGRNDITNDSWSYDTVNTCDNLRHIFCFEQTGVVTGTYFAAACGVKDFSFTDDPDAALSTLTSSDIVLIDTDACSAPVDITGEGSPEFRICNDATCSVVNHAWGSAQQSIDDGEYLQLRLTSGGEHVSRSATVTVGSSIRDWNVLAATYKYVFVSSTTSNGDLGGRAGADATCQSLADTAGLAGTYKAWLGQNTDGAPAGHFTQWSGQYRLSNGTTKVADSWSDLTDGTLDNAISRDENHNTVTETRVWSSALEDGMSVFNFLTTYDIPVFEDCVQWTDDTNSYRGYIGRNDRTNATWAYNATSINNCNQLRHIFCFEQ